MLLLGAETEVGRAVADALASAGADVAVVAATSDAEAAFAVQRLARRLSAVAQAIDATNEMAVRVMVRQVAKQLGGLDAVVFCLDIDPSDRRALDFALVYGARQMERGGGGVFVEFQPGPARLPVEVLRGVKVRFLTTDEPVEKIVKRTARAVAGAPNSR